MLWSIASASIVLWGIGLVTSTMIEGYIHVLLAVAAFAIVLKINLILKRRELKLLKIPKYQRLNRHITERASLQIW